VTISDSAGHYAPGRLTDWLTATFMVHLRPGDRTRAFVSTQASGLERAVTF
jgi:hypothetical protein